MPDTDRSVAEGTRSVVEGLRRPTNREEHGIACLGNQGSFGALENALDLDQS